MFEFRRILCPIDFSEFSVRAYGYALSLAEHYRAKLVAQHIVELWQYPSVGFVASAELYEEFSQTLHEKAKKRLQEFVKNYTHDETQPECIVQQGIAADSILAFAEGEKTDLMVMGTHGRRGFDRLMLGSVTERVMRRASCPVLAVSRLSNDLITSGKQGDHAHYLSRILFCTDFSENSEQALDYATSLTAEYNAELTLLHVLEDVPSAANIEEAIPAAKERLDRLIPPEGRKAGKIKTIVLVGKPYQQIIQFALETHADIVTMAVRGRGAVDLAVFGSTTYRVLQMGPCPVLVVHV
jgi:nucleotide-binding universal stress UspA family protein